MKPAFATSVLLSILLALNFSPSFQSTTEADWSYVCTTCPDQWGNLKPEYSACLVKNNVQQSPINIVKRKVITGKKGNVGQVLKTRRGKYEVEFVANGLHFACKPENTCGTLKLGQKVYALVQFHFHTQSEHRINGKDKPFEIHMVHKASDGSLAVFGVLVETGKKQIDLTKPLNAITSKEEFEFDLGDVVEKSSGYYRYLGGLTTPPCTGGVQWVLQSSMGKMPKSQVKRFLNLVGPPSRGNWRPVQPLSGRDVELFNDKKTGGDDDDDDDDDDGDN